MPVTFVGVEIEPRQQREYSSIVVTRGTAARTTLVARAEGITSLQQAAEFIAHHATANTVVAIDAPLIVRNHGGQRPCDLEIDRRFGRLQVPGGSANPAVPPDPAGARCADLLRWDGFRHDPRLEEPRMHAGRWLFEVQAHPAAIVLFGDVARTALRATHMSTRRAALRRLQGHLRSLSHGTPRLELTPALVELIGRDVGALRGRRQFESYRASLDAVVCSYVAAHVWRWGGQRNEIIGDLESGYVIVPAVPHVPDLDGASVVGARPDGVDGEG